MSDRLLLEHDLMRIDAALLIQRTPALRLVPRPQVRICFVFYFIADEDVQTAFESTNAAWINLYVCNSTTPVISLPLTRHTCFFRDRY
jgi:hypothetical protein